MAHFRLAAGIFAAMLLVGSANADVAQQDDPVPGAMFGIAPQPDERAAAEIVVGMASVHNAPDALALMDRALTLLPQPTRYRGMVQCVRFGALASIQPSPSSSSSSPRAEAERALAECDRLLPDEPFAQMLVGLNAVQHNDVRRAADRLAFALAAQPDLEPQISHEAIDRILLDLSYRPHSSERERLLNALRGTAYARDRPEQIEIAVDHAMADAIRAGRTAEAVALLPDVTTVSGALDLLVDRRFAPIWPNIERWAGDLTALRDAAAAHAQAAYARDGSLENRQRYARALVAGGQAENAVTLLRAAIADRTQWDGIEGAGYDIAATATTLANTLASLGRDAEGRAVLDAMERAWAGKLFEGRANLLVNKARLEAWGPNPTAALAEADRAEAALRSAEAAPPGPGAYLWYDAIRVCALARSGHVGEARAKAEPMRAVAAANRRAVDMATLCLGDRLAFRAQLLGALGDDESRGATLRDLQRPARLHAGVQDAAEQRMIADLRANPEIRLAFGKAGRQLGAAYVGALKGWRD